MSRAVLWCRDGASRLDVLYCREAVPYIAPQVEELVRSMSSSPEARPKMSCAEPNLGVLRGTTPMSAPALP